MINLIISITIFGAYLAYIYDRFGMQPSISASYYNLPGKLKYIFTLVLWGFSIPLAMSSEYLLIFLAVAFICFTAAAPAFNDRVLEFRIHMIGAYGGIILGMLSVIINYQMYYLAGAAVIASLFFWKYSHYPIWFIEVTAFLTIWLVLFLDYKLF